MHKGFAPKKNAAHRLACLSLYKSLLKTCTELPSAHQPNSGAGHKSSSAILRALVRYRFKADKSIQSWRQCRDALHFGRKVLHLLYEATTGSSVALGQITSILSHTKSSASRCVVAIRHIQNEHDEEEPPLKLKLAKEREAHLLNKTSYRRQPGTVPVLNRPVPYEQALKHKDGRRHVPDYFVVQGIPILRYTHRQPLSLGRYITQITQKFDRLWLKIPKQEQTVQIADDEDSWDKQLWLDHKLQHPDLDNGNPRSEEAWVHVHRKTLRDTNTQIYTKDVRKMEYAAKLWEVYLKEKELAEAENTQRKSENAKRWQEQKMKEGDNDADNAIGAAAQSAEGPGEHSSEQVVRSTPLFRRIAS